MAIAVANAVKGTGGPAASATTAAMNSAATGSTFVVAVLNESATLISAPTDSKGNTYTRIGTGQNGSLAGYQSYLTLWYCQNGTGGSGHTFTAGSNYTTLFAVEITGGLTSGILDQTADAHDTATPYTTAGVTTTQADELLLSVCMSDAGAPTFAIAGYTIDSSETDGANHWTGAIASQVVASINTYNPSWTDGGSNAELVYFATFKAAGGAATPSFVPMAPAFNHLLTR